MLYRENDAPLGFDLVKVQEQSKDNPVFYVQYAHARAQSVVRMAKEAFPQLSADALLKADLGLLQDPGEIDVIRKLAAFLASSRARRGPMSHTGWRSISMIWLRFFTRNGRKATIATFALYQASDGTLTAARLALIRPRRRCWPRVWRLLAYTLRTRCDRVPIERVHGEKFRGFGHVSERSDWLSGDATAATSGRRSLYRAANWPASAAALAAALWRAVGPTRPSAGLSSARLQSTSQTYGGKRHLATTSHRPPGEPPGYAPPGHQLPFGNPGAPQRAQTVPGAMTGRDTISASICRQSQGMHRPGPTHSNRGTSLDCISTIVPFRRPTRLRRDRRRLRRDVGGGGGRGRAAVVGA